MNFKSIQSYSTSYAFRHFDCGDPNLNKYIRTHAKQNDSNNLSKTYICENDDQVVGFVTLCNAQIEFEAMPEEYKASNPKYPVPAIRIARLAVDINQQSKGIGKALLWFALRKILQAAYIVGTKFVVVDAKEDARGFYEKYGFVLLADSTYILPIETLIKSIV